MQGSQLGLATRLIDALTKVLEARSGWALGADSIGCNAVLNLGMLAGAYEQEMGLFVKHFPKIIKHMFKDDPVEVEYKELCAMPLCQEVQLT